MTKAKAKTETNEHIYNNAEIPDDFAQRIETINWGIKTVKSNW